MPDNPLKPFKLFPRNLTARADTVVRGNPVNSRPESGVENAWPGLEFDHRNLEKAFLPGLVFEYQDERGTILREFAPKSPAAHLIKKADIQKGIYLAFVQGRVIESSRDAQPEQRVFSFAPPAAMENWRVIRDFEPGPVAVALCNRSIYERVLANNTELLTQFSVDGLTELFRTRKNRREGGFVLLFGERATWLTAEGVIDPQLVPPGDLTRSMCSPWQYDFTDCGCFFWASNKPDLVASADQPAQILNFQRKDRSKDAARQPSDWLLKDAGNWDAINVLGHVDIINHFNALKFVTARQERDDYVPPAPLPVRPLSRLEIIERLRILATVEHALSVEYLYAYYSLKLPPGSGPRREPWDVPGRPAQEGSEEARLFTAGDEVLRVAIDEMRHFRWVNEMLLELGEHWVLDRATVIGIDFPEQKGFNQPFALVPLTGNQLDWFIKVEKASPNHANPATIDGMYTRILLSIEQGADFAADPAKRERLAQFVKMIIDEGVDHYARFVRARNALEGTAERRYLRVTSGPAIAPAGSPARILQEVADGSYAVLLQALDYVFRQDSAQRGALLEAARRAMYNLDAACRSLSELKTGALFTLSVPAEAALARPVAGVLAASATTPHDVGEPLRPHLQRLRETADPKLNQLADRMEDKLAEMVTGLGVASRA
jgi:ferritin-like protein